MAFIFLKICLEFQLISVRLVRSHGQWWNCWKFFRVPLFARPYRSCVKLWMSHQWLCLIRLWLKNLSSSRCSVTLLSATVCVCPFSLKLQHKQKGDGERAARRERSSSATEAGDTSLAKALRSSYNAWPRWGQVLQRLRREERKDGESGRKPWGLPSRLILINPSGFIWWGKNGGGRDRREESEIKSEGGQPEDLLLKGRNGIFRRIKR